MTKFIRTTDNFHCHPERSEGSQARVKGKKEQSDASAESIPIYRDSAWQRAVSAVFIP